MPPEQSALVIGAGLGGLASAARMLRQDDLAVEVAERMSFAGGRFTQHDHDGFQVPTGAVHMIPHGRKGPLSKLLFGKTKNGGLDLGRYGAEFLPTTRFAGLQTGGQHKSCNSALAVMRWFGWKDRLRLPGLLATGAKQPWGAADEEDGRTWLSRRFTTEFIDFLDSFSNFAVSLRFDQMPASTVVRMLQNCFHLDRPHVPRGGCKGIIDALRKDIKQQGGKVRLSHEVTEILPGASEEATKKNRFCVGLRRRGRNTVEWKGYDAIIANCGHPNLLDSLSDDFAVAAGVTEQVTRTQSVGGIGFVFSLDSDIPQQHSGVTMTPNMERLGGYVIPTFSEPALAPQGKHMLISHQFVPSSDIQSEISKGREELYEAIPWLADKGEELCVHSYHRNWPCNRAPQGADLPADIGIEGLRMVGDGVKGHGWMMVEGIASNVPQAVDAVLSELPLSNS